MKNEIYKKTIVCLANSRKKGGLCVAGKEWVNGKPGPWIRPVFDKDGGELPKWLVNKIKLLDIIEFSFQSPQPLSYQKENHVVEGYEKKGCLSWEELKPYLDHPKGVFFRKGK